MPDSKPTVYRLNELEVHEVSLVDKPANQRKFLLVKNVDGDASHAEDLSVADKTDSKKNDVDDAMADKAAEETTLVTELHPQVQAALADTLSKAGDRLLALATSVKSAKVAAADTAPGIPQKLLTEIGGIHEGLGSMLVSKAKGMADPDKKKETEDASDKDKKGEGDAKDDPSEGDEGGKPFPPKKGKDKDSAKKADDLFGALEVISKTDITFDAMTLLYQQAAKQAVSAAQDACWDNDYTKAAKYSGMAAELFARVSNTEVAMAAKIGDLQAALAEAAGVTKAGKKMSQARWNELDKSLRALLDIAEEVQPGYLADVAGVAKSGAGKSETIQRLVDLVRKKDTQIKSLQGGARPASNTLGTGEEGEGTDDDSVSWPQDMNADYNRDDYPEDLKF